MKRLLCLGLLGVLGATISMGCEASAKVDPDVSADHASVHSTEVHKDYPNGDTVEHKTETRTTVSP